MWLPSFSVKFRTQPTWSDGSSFSIVDCAMAGCQAIWLLKSRRIAQTRSIGASMMAERTTRIIGEFPHPEERAQRASRRVGDTAIVAHPSRRPFGPPQDEVGVDPPLLSDASESSVNRRPPGTR